MDTPCMSYLIRTYLILREFLSTTTIWNSFYKISHLYSNPIFCQMSPFPLQIPLSLGDNLGCPLQVNLFQKRLFLHQLTQNMTKDCSLNYKKNTSSEAVVYKYRLEYQNKNKRQFLYTTYPELVFFL